MVSSSCRSCKVTISQLFTYDSRDGNSNVRYAPETKSSALGPDDIVSGLYRGRDERKWPEEFAKLI
jgi:hypothetical protein